MSAMRYLAGAGARKSPDANMCRRNTGANPNFEGKTVSSASAALGMKLGALRQLELNLPLPSAEHRAARGEVQGAEPPPAAFDSREKWGSSCNSIATIRNQGACGSCWVRPNSCGSPALTCLRIGRVHMNSCISVSASGFRCGRDSGGPPLHRYRFPRVLVSGHLPSWPD